MFNLGTTFQKLWGPPGKNLDHSNKKKTIQGIVGFIWVLSVFILHWKDWWKTQWQALYMSRKLLQERGGICFLFVWHTGKQFVGL